MHIRPSRVTRNGKTYEYAQLVESYRRPDGMPAHRVIASFPAGSLDVDNLRLALEATRNGRRVTPGRQVSRVQAAPQPVANLRYLDVAVILELWRGWGLDDVLTAALGRSEATVAATSVVAALTIQRCVDPGSKLYATRWLPRTALPQLLGLPIESFNNTRLHRVLDDLDVATPSLMAKLVERYQDRETSFAALFMDVTDVWFVGDGPALAERSKTKEGRVARKIGIVLMCNEHGYPLRWEVIAGRESEVVAMSRMVESVASAKWAQQLPLVCDRAMGRTAQVRKMLDCGLHFLTALTTTEFDAYTTRVPHTALATLQPPDAARRDHDIAQASRCIEQAGLERVDDTLFVLDLGIVERVDEQSAEPAAGIAETDAIAHVMQLARSIDQDMAAGRYTSLASAGRARGLSKQLVARYRILRRLPEAVQQQILDGQTRGRALDELIRIARLADEPQQCRAFAALLSTPVSRRASARPLGVSATSSQPRSQPVRVRAVLYFNPQIFVDERLRAQDRLKAVQSFVDDLNARLASPSSRLRRDQIAAAIDRHLRKDNLVEAFATHISEQDIGDRKRYHVRLVLDELEWSRRRRYDGFSVLVAHPDIQRTAPALCRLYRAKDAIEKDFQTIKTVVELRPIWHHTDAKVRAHVALCMLALLLQRTLARKLAGLCSAESALEILATAHLNRFVGSDGTVAHVVTRTDADQNRILRRLQLQRLADYHCDHGTAGAQ
jgi:hypothetical protein